jgi:hypothetical protein
MTSTNEEQASTQTGPATTSPRATKRAKVAPQKPRVARGKPGSQKKARAPQGQPKSQKAAKRAKPGAAAREGSKAGKVLALLKRSEGASLKELMKATGWQAHSVRGFLSGTVSKRMALSLVSVKGEDGERRYSLKN